jgi:hypothetical protein
MKKQLFILSILNLFFYCSVFSQNWNLINPDFRYNYSKNDESIISITIWIDSLSLNESSDTVYHLNRIVMDCDTCESLFLYNGPSRFAFYNQPNFLQREVIVTDTTYWFVSPNSFVFYPKEKVSYNWIYDSINYITANIISANDSIVFGTIDSVKTIQLSNQDTIIISKEFGILQFDDINDNRYFLVGIDNLFGDSVPDFFEFYNFSVGDIFEYTGRYYSVGYGRYTYREKVYIISKTIYKDSVIYDVHIKYYEFDDYGKDYPFYEPYKNSYDSIWIFKYSTNHHANRYNNELIPFLDISYNWHSFPPFADYTYSKFYYDLENRFTKSIGSYENCDFMSIYDTSQHILERRCDYFDAYEIIYTVGLGTVYYDHTGFEWTDRRELVAYVKDNDTTGTITEDEFFTNIDNKSYLNSVIFYPNPAIDKIFVKTENEQIVDEIKIIGLDGQIYKASTYSNEISIKELKPNLYIIEILLNQIIIRKKILIN